MLRRRQNGGWCCRGTTALGGLAWIYEIRGGTNTWTLLAGVPLSAVTVAWLCRRLADRAYTRPTGKGEGKR